MISQSLRNFSKQAAAITPANPFDPRSYAAYCMMAVWWIIVMIFLMASDFTLGTNALNSTIVVMILLLATALIARRYHLARIAIVLECIAIISLAGALTVTSTVILATFSFPFADALLLKADDFLGFNWLSLLSFHQATPGMIRFFSFPYSAMLPQMLLVPILLYLVATETKLWTFITAWTFSCLITTVIFPFAPAEGPYIRFGVTPADVRELTTGWQWRFGPLISELQTGKIRDLSQAMMGIVSFPSFHAAAAVMFAWAGLQLRWLGPPIILLNLAMAFSTLINGAHYLTDVLAGIAVGIGSIYAAPRLIKNCEAFVDNFKSRLANDVKSATSD